MAAVRRNRRLRRQQAVPRPRVFQDRDDPLGRLNDDELFERYRFRRTSIIFIEDELRDELSSSTKRSFPIQPMLQVLICLRFLATGAFHLTIADTVRVSRSSVFRCIRRVCAAVINLLMRTNITFPKGEHSRRVMEGFRQISGFPKVLGCVDGTQIKIATPNNNEQDFVNRKGFHSLNVQMVCDPKFRVTSLCANWPGSVHDSRIWRQCELNQQFQNGIHDGILLGDSGYPCLGYLMTPFLHPANRAEENFNTSLCRTRVLIEQTFGILKRRFAILHFGIRSTPQQAVIFITTCVILHNLGIDRGDVVVNDKDFLDSDHDKDNTNFDAIMTADGLKKRSEIAKNFFS